MIDRNEMSCKCVYWIPVKVTVFWDMEYCSLSDVTVLKETAMSVSKLKDIH